MATKEVGFGATRLPIKPFKINEMVDHCTIAMIAKRATGKSFLTRGINNLTLMFLIMSDFNIQIWGLFSSLSELTRRCARLKT